MYNADDFNFGRSQRDANVYGGSQYAVHGWQSLCKAQGRALDNLNIHS